MSVLLTENHFVSTVEAVVLPNEKANNNRKDGSVKLATDTTSVKYFVGELPNTDNKAKLAAMLSGMQMSSALCSKSMADFVEKEGLDKDKVLIATSLEVVDVQLNVKNKTLTVGYWAKACYDVNVERACYFFSGVDSYVPMSFFDSEKNNASGQVRITSTEAAIDFVENKLADCVGCKVIVKTTDVDEVAHERLICFAEALQQAVLQPA